VCALALVQQLLVHGGFHDAQGFVRVEGVQARLIGEAAAALLAQQ
jgi:hypothetical protein